MFQLRDAPTLRSRPSFYFRDSKGTMLPSSLEERIRLLTDRAIAAKSQSELEAILPELKAAIREHIRCVRDIAVATIPEAFGKSNGLTTSRAIVNH
jgi:hypothetical protein